MENAGHSMQLTRAADYAIRVMIHMAGLPDKTRTLLPELAQVTGAPESFLSKILQSLRRSGFIASQRGSAGGFEILPAGRTATICSVIEAIEGPIRLNICVMRDDLCSRQGHCPAHPLWVKAQGAVINILNAETIVNLAEGHLMPPSRQIQSQINVNF